MHTKEPVASKRYLKILRDNPGTQFGKTPHLDNVLKMKLLNEMAIRQTGTKGKGRYYKANVWPG